MISEFGGTTKFSNYLLCICAGPFEEIQFGDPEQEEEQEGEISMSLYVKPSLLEKLKTQ
jgi:hypothetical protein